jgi:hypothetical protein
MASALELGFVASKGLDYDFLSPNRCPALLGLPAQLLSSQPFSLYGWPMVLLQQLEEL